MCKTIYKLLPLFFLLLVLLFIEQHSHASTYIKGPALIQEGTATAKAAGTTVLTKDSQTYQILTGTSTQIVQLPNATTIPVGRQFNIVNSGASGVITVNDTGGNLLTTIQGTTSKYLWLRTAGSANGVWEVVDGNVNAAGITGVLPIANGGTNGIAVPVSGAVAYGTGAAYAFTAAGSSGQILTSAGTASPTWTTILPIANGGTNATATPTAGALAYGTGTAYAFSASGVSGTILRAAGTGAPTWSTLTVPATVTAPAAMVVNTTNTMTGLAATAANTVMKTDGSTISFGNIFNANVDASAAIAYTKIDFTGSPFTTTPVSSSSTLTNYVITFNQWGDLTSVSLTAGTWMCFAQAVYYSNGVVTTTGTSLGVSSTSGSVGPTIGASYVQGPKGLNNNDANSLALTVFLSPVATTTYYLKGFAFTSTTNLQVAYIIGCTKQF